MEFFLELGELFVGEVGSAEVGLMRVEMMMMMMMTGEWVMMRPKNAVTDAHVTTILQRTTYTRTGNSHVYNTILLTPLTPTVAI